MIYFWVAIGGSLGALARFGIQTYWIQHSALAILCINALGCLILGFVMQKAWNPQLLTAVISGFCGSLTTFSTWIYLQSAFVQANDWWKLGAYILLSLLSGAFALFIGHSLGKL